MAVLPGEGTLLQMGDGGGTEVFATIAQRTEIDGPEISGDEVDKTNLDSVFKEYRRSKIPDPGELDMTIQFDPADTGHQTLEERAASGEVGNFRLVWNNETSSRPHRQFAAAVKTFKPTGMVVGENLLAEVTLKLTGPITSGTTVIP